MLGRQLVIFYLCSGEPPIKLDDSNSKMPSVQIFIIVANVLNIALAIRIQLEKIRSPTSITDSGIKSLKVFGSSHYNTQELVTMAITTSIFFITAILNSFFNGVNPERLNTFHLGVVLQVFRMVWPVIVAFALFLTHFLKRPKARAVLKVAFKRAFCLK